MADENTKSFTDTLSAISPFASMGANLFSGFLNNIFNKNSAEKQFERQKELQKIQQDYNMQAMERQNELNNQSWFNQFQAQNRENRQMLLNKPSYDREGLVQAGYNPASQMSGFSPTVSGASGGTASMPSSGLGSAGMQAPSSINFGDFAQMSMQSPLIRAQARKVNADAEWQELVNQGKREANDVYGTGQVTPRAFVNPDKPYLVEFELVNSKRKPISTKEGFDAVKDITKWYKQDLQEIDSAGVSAELRQLVSQYQIDSDIWQSIAELPDANISYILSMKSVQDALQNVHIYDGKIKQFTFDELLPIEKELINLQKTEQEEFKLGPLLAEMKKEFGDGNYLKAFGTLIQMLFVSIIQNVKGSVSAGISHITK